MNTITLPNRVIAIKSNGNQANILRKDDAKRIKRCRTLKQGERVLNLLNPEDRKQQSEEPQQVSAYVLSDYRGNTHPYARANKIVELDCKQNNRMTPRELIAHAQAAGASKHAQVVAAVLPPLPPYGGDAA